MRNFKDLQLSPQLDAAVKALGFKELSSLQLQAIPMALTGRDIHATVPSSLAKAASSAAAFVVPVVARILKNPRKMALILSSDKERATITIDLVQKLIQGSSDVQAFCAIPGMDIGTQIRALLKRPRIVVSTPDRLVELLKKGACSLSSAEILVFDGLDEMMEKNFGVQINHILRFVPRARQTMIFTEALEGDAKTLAAKTLKDPIKAEATIDSPKKPLKASTPSAVLAGAGRAKSSKTSRVERILPPIAVPPQGFALKQSPNVKSTTPNAATLLAATNAASRASALKSKATKRINQA